MFHTEDESFGGLSSIPILDQFASMYGYELAGIHPTNAGYLPRIKPTYATLEHAWKIYHKHLWVYLTPNAETYIDEYDHPREAVYVVGHDRFGYGETNLDNGFKIKLRTVKPFVGHAIPTLIAVACDRWTRTRR